jgi:UPF0716 protein FxsA
MPLLIALIVVPLVEIALFIEVGGAIGLWATIALVLISAVAGAALLRAQGLATLSKLQAELERGGDPTGSLAHGALLLFAGALLLTPGFFTDAVGLALMSPQVRAWAIAKMGRRIVTVAAARARRPDPGRHDPRNRGPRRPAPDDGAPIEAEYRDVTPGGEPDASSPWRGRSGE